MWPLQSSPMKDSATDVRCRAIWGVESGGSVTKEPPGFIMNTNVAISPAYLVTMTAVGRQGGH